MSSRIGKVILATLVAGIVIALGVVAFTRVDERRDAQRAIADYNVALTAAVSALDPDQLAPVASERESSRVASYITLLWGRGVTMDAELLEADVVTLMSAEPTVTVVMDEKWSYIERDRESGQQIGDPVEEDQQIRYTLVRTPDGRFVVYLTELVEGAEGSEPK